MIEATKSRTRERRKAEARREREAGRRELGRKGVVFGTLISVLAVLGGAVVGFITTLAIVVARARAGSYIFGLHELAAIRWETLPVLLGMAAGVTLAILHPRALDRATVRGFVGLLAGAVLGAFLGRLLWGPEEGKWAGGIIFGAAGLLVGAALSLTVHRPSRGPRPLLAGGLGSSLLLAGAAFLAMGFTRLITSAPLELPEYEAIPVPDAGVVDAVVFLVGDAGATERGRSPLLRALGGDIEQWSEDLARDSAVSIAFLGDLVYPVGVRDRTHPQFETDSTRLWNQIDLVGGERALEHAALGLFLPGNHDWGNVSGLEGYDRILNLADQLQIARADGHHVSLQPPGGQPGPSIRDLRNNVRLVFLDTHWFLQARTAADREAFFERVEAVIESAGDRELIFTAHHPYRSAGPHGAIIPGYHTGGVAYLLKKSGTLVQDLNSTVYEELLRRLRTIFESHGKPPLVFAGGHDHSLQVIRGNGDYAPRFSLVSGAGSKLSGIRNAPGLAWGAHRPGYMMLVFRNDDAVDLFVVAGDSDALSCDVPEGELEACMTEGANSFEIAYSVSLLGPSGNPLPLPTASGDSAPGTPWHLAEGERPTASPHGESGSETVLAPPVAVPGRVLATGTDSVRTTLGKSYSATAVHRFFFGDLNRHLWNLPLDLPVLDLAQVGGGLEPLELSGGKQTIGLRFVGGDGRQYEFRAVVKDPSRALPELLHESAVDEVVDDQMAALFPLAALVVTELQEAAGILAPRPVPVVMPNDARLGPYRGLFAGRVGLFTVDVNEGIDGGPGFAGYSRVVGTARLYEILDEDPRSRVNARHFLRIRLLDALVGDWDRHSGQWRWAARETTDSTVWQPIPVDRDWAFVRIDGLLNRLGGSLLFPRYVGFSDRFPPAERLAESGYRVDHRVMNGLDRDDFLAAAGELREALADSVLERAVNTLPEAYRELERERLTAALRARRAALLEYAAEYWRAFTGTVHVYGYVGRRDVVVFTPLDEDRVRVRVHRGDVDGPVTFERVVDGTVTRRVRVFVDDDEDETIGYEGLAFDVEIDEPEDDGEDRDY